MLTKFFLVLFVLSVFASILADELPGSWWQWILAAVLFGVAAGIAGAEES